MAEWDARVNRPHKVEVHRRVRPNVAPARRRESRPFPAKVRNQALKLYRASLLSSPAPIPAEPRYCFHPGRQNGSGLQSPPAPNPDSENMARQRAPHRGRASLSPPLFHRWRREPPRGPSSRPQRDSPAPPLPLLPRCRYRPASPPAPAGCAPYRTPPPTPSFQNQSLVISWNSSSPLL